MYEVTQKIENINAVGVELGNDIIEELPKKFIPVFWRYDSRNYNDYYERLNEYKKINGKVLYWGGILT